MVTVIGKLFGEFVCSVQVRTAKARELRELYDRICYNTAFRGLSLPRISHRLHYTLFPLWGGDKICGVGNNSQRLTAQMRNQRAQKFRSVLF